MARKKTLDVAKFGGVDELGKAKVNGHVHELNSIETQSQTKLESDLGIGKEVIMRSFTFKLDRDAFKAAPPSKQILFDSHVKGLEMALWRDGLIFEKSHEPHILFNKKRTHYTIFIVASPARGQVVLERPQTLSEIAHG
jgi:hypothetical protein